MGCNEAAQERSCSKKRNGYVKGERGLAVNNHHFPDNFIFLKSIHQNFNSGQTSYYILKIQHIVLILEHMYL